MTLSIFHKVKFSENLKQGFKRTAIWNKYRSEIKTQPKYNDLDYMIDPAFRNNNILLVHSFKAGENDSVRNCLDKYYTWLVEVKDFNAAGIKNKPFLIFP